MPETGAEVAIQARGLEKTYAMGEVTVRAFRGVDFTLHRRELVVLLGPSGSGKSTLLNILGGLDVPTAGSLFYAGQDLSHPTEEGLTRYRREHIGFIFQFYNLIPRLTARENVAIVADIAERAMSPDEALAMVGLSPRGDHYPSQMSGRREYNRRPVIRGGRLTSTALAHGESKLHKFVDLDGPLARAARLIGIELGDGSPTSRPEERSGPSERHSGTAARPDRGPEARELHTSAFTMQTPIHVTFHELPHSDAVEAHVRKQAAKLERFSERIIACHVVLEGPHRHEHRGRDYQVRVDLVVPRGELVVSHSTGDDSTHDDLFAAIDGAFDRVGRRLEDHVRRQRGDVKAHERDYRGDRATKV